MQGCDYFQGLPPRAFSTRGLSLRIEHTVGDIGMCMTMTVLVMIGWTRNVSIFCPPPSVVATVIKNAVSYQTNEICITA